MENLYLKRLFAELEFCTTDCDIKNELFSKYQINFNKDVAKYLEDNPILKKAYDDFMNDNSPSVPDITKMTDEEIKEYRKKLEEQAESLSEGDFADQLEKRSFKEDPDVKRIYRMIVKITHPDKTDNLEYKSLHLDATDAYENNQIYRLVKIALKLNLDIGDLSDENLDKLENELKFIKREIQGIENNLVWKYFETIKEKDRYKVIEEYVMNFINEISKF